MVRQGSELFSGVCTPNLHAMRIAYDNNNLKKTGVVRITGVLLYEEVFFRLISESLGVIPSRTYNVVLNTDYFYGTRKKKRLG